MKRLVLFVLAVTLAWSPTYAATTPAKAAKPATPALQVIDVGPSAVLLEQGWKFQPGDSPWVNGAPLWAQPGYDDAGWAGMKFVPKAGAVNPYFGTPIYGTEWTGKGYSHLRGYAWYRLRVRVAHPDQRLWLKMPDMFTNGFELYANGHYVGQFGNPSKRHFPLHSQPVSFALPRPGPDGVLTLALRFYVSPATLVSGIHQGSHVGGMQGPPAVGLASTVKLMQASEKGFLLRGKVGGFFLILLCLLTAPLALWAWLYDRQAHLWLWLFLTLVFMTAVALNDILGTLWSTYSAGEQVAVSSLSIPMWGAAFTLFWWHWFRLEKKRWIPRTALWLAGAIAVAYFLLTSIAMGFDFVPLSALPWLTYALGVLLLAQALWFGAPLIEGFRKDRVDALLPAVTILIALFLTFEAFLRPALHIPPVFFLFGLGFVSFQVLGLVEIVVIVGLSLRRFLRTQVQASLEREAIHRDLEDAHELQQLVLVPEAVESRNFTVEAEYHPAQKVGGDFFQTVTRPDGTLLVVIGDVSGKGVSAAMLVAVLVGTIRNQAEHSFDPQQMLSVLNHCMMGRSGGHFATCLAAEISPDGTMRIANAGHLSPYRNGAELELDGALPLGLSPDAEYALQTVQLHSGDRLTFITDGVIEAQNQSKELFGFDRARSISTQAANQIANTAANFGQEDDITVLGVAFAAA